MIPAATELDSAELSALLHFYADAGVEWLLEDEPVDRLAQFAALKAERAAAKRAEQPQAADRQPAGNNRGAGASAGPRSAGASSPAMATGTGGTSPVTMPDADAVAAARLAADNAGSLDELKASVEGFNGCNLKNGARSTVFMHGGTASGLMVIGPMPNADDDREGTPFSGRNGQFLERMLAAIGLQRDNVLTTNIIPWRPPGNRMPSPAELDICRPFLDRQIALAQPKTLLLLGNFPARFFFGGNGTIHSLRGEFRSVSIAGQDVPAIATLHPQELLAAAGNKALAWQDLLLLKKRINAAT